MIRGIGIDLLEISRLERPMKNERFKRYVFTERELEYLSERALASAAGLFCAKEAAAKAMGVSVFKELKRIEIMHLPSGQPYVSGYPGFILSITHTGTTAAAVAVWSE